MQNDFYKIDFNLLQPLIGCQLLAIQGILSKGKTHISGYILVFWRQEDRVIDLLYIGYQYLGALTNTLYSLYRFIINAIEFENISTFEESMTNYLMIFEDVFILKYVNIYDVKKQLHPSKERILIHYALTFVSQKGEKWLVRLHDDDNGGIYYFHILQDVDNVRENDIVKNSRYRLILCKKIK